MMRVVVDTNVFVSSFFGGNPRKIVDLWKEERITICLSKEIIDEYVEVLEGVGLDQEETKELLALFARGFHSLFTSKTPRIRAVRADPGDNKFIECAAALKAEVIITGDKALRELKEYLGVKIYTPAQFLEKYP